MRRCKQNFSALSFSGCFRPLAPPRQKSIWRKKKEEKNRAQDKSEKKSKTNDRSTTSEHSGLLTTCTVHNTALEDRSSVKRGLSVCLAAVKWAEIDRLSKWNVKNCTKIQRVHKCILISFQLQDRSWSQVKERTEIYFLSFFHVSSSQQSKVALLGLLAFDTPHWGVTPMPSGFGFLLQ